MGSGAPGLGIFTRKHPSFFPPPPRGSGPLLPPPLYPRLPFSSPLDRLERQKAHKPKELLPVYLP